MGDNGPNPQAAPFNRAHARFRMDLKKKDQETFRKTTLADLKQCIGEIQDRQHSSRRLQGLNRIQPFLEAVEQFGKVVTIFANSNDVVAFVWGPVRMLLLISSTYAEAFKELLDTYQQIGENLPLLMQYEELFRKNPHMSRVLALMYEDILKFHRSAMMYFHKPLWKQMFAATWKTHKSQFSEIISNMARHRQLVENQATIAHIEEAQKSRRIADAQLEINARMENMRRLKTVFDWLRPANIEADHHSHIKIRAEYPGISRWILDNAAFQEWFNPSYPMIPPLLWISGIPGAGKTVLTSLIIEEAQKLTTSPTVVYFYCKHQDPERDNYRIIARTILAQLLKQDRDLLAYFFEKCCESSEPVLESRKTIEILLNEAFNNCESAYIIIDGLDECGRENRKDISKWFRCLVEDLPTAQPERLRCLFVSQDDGFARNDLKGIANIKIRPEDVRTDMDLYCRSQADKLMLDPFYLAHERATSIASIVSKSAAGMFLLAKLTWINIFDQTSIAGLEEELEPDVFPRGLNDAYERIMTRIEAQASPARWKEVLMVLGWLVCAKRPLRWHEIQVLKAMNLNTGTIEYDRQRFLPSPVDLFHSLVEYREDGTVQLVHLSAMYFFIDEDKFNLAAEELKFATICVDYLNLSTLVTPTEIAVRNGDYGLLDYAVLYWIRHFEAGIIQVGRNEDHLQIIAESLETFIRNHWRGTTRPLPVSNRNRDKLKFFQRFQYYNQLEQTIVSFRKQSTFFGKMSEEEIALDLEEVTISIRKMLEASFQSFEEPSINEDMVQKYGAGIFKCPRFSCHFFTNGFATSQDRDKHIGRHERPFRCPEEACTGFTFGFMSASDLDRHTKETHSRRSLETEQFPTDLDVQESLKPSQSKKLPALIPSTQIRQPEQEAMLHPIPAMQRTRKKLKPEKFECNYCGNTYTKKYNWESHLLSHNTDKPFKCALCDASFSRLSDERRHRSTHTDKTHICLGQLRNGESWGCGKTFARADILRSHHKSNTGQLCIHSFLQEQQLERSGSSSSTAVPGTESSKETHGSSFV